MATTGTLSFLTVVLATVLGAPPAFALTAGEFLDKLDGKYQTGFIIGAVDMAAHLFALNDLKKGQCTLDWLHHGDRTKALTEINTLFGANRDKDSITLLHYLINRKCGE